MVTPQTTNNLKRAVGAFSTRHDAEKALIELRDAGFNMDRVSAIAERQSKNIADVEVQTTNKRAKEGAETGAVMGATTGGMLGLVGSLSILAIPGVGVAIVPKEKSVRRLMVRVAARLSLDSPQV